MTTGSELETIHAVESQFDSIFTWDYTPAVRH